MRPLITCTHSLDSREKADEEAPAKLHGRPADCTYPGKVLELANVTSTMASGINDQICKLGP